MVSEADACFCRGLLAVDASPAAGLRPGVRANPHGKLNFGCNVVAYAGELIAAAIYEALAKGS
jgi:hypothetical protein